MERVIGYLNEQIQLHSNPYANLSQCAIEQARANTLKSLVPNVVPPLPKQKLGTFVLLSPHDIHFLEDSILNAFHELAQAQGWPIQGRKRDIRTDHFARLCLPNKQIVKALWHEKKHEDKKVCRAHNIKVTQSYICNEPTHPFQFISDNETQFGEVIYFFQVVLDQESQYTLAAVRQYSNLNQTLFRKSCTMLQVYEFLGDKDIVLIDAKSIVEVVGMLPFVCHAPGGCETNYPEFYVLKEMSMVGWVADEKTTEKDMDSDDEDLEIE